MSSWILTDSEVKHFRRFKKRRLLEGKPMVLWGWKRDKLINSQRQPESRTVYFSADLAEKNNVVSIKRSFFFLDTRAKDEELKVLLNHTGDSRMLGTQKLNVLYWPDQVYPGYSRLRIWVGEMTPFDEKSVQRRLLGKPRITIGQPKLIPEHDNYNLRKFAPFSLCVGSGLSAESGLPLLGSIHDLFEVDNMESGQLIFGASDNLPKRIVQNLETELAKFCEFSIMAVKAQPSSSHQLLAKLFKKGVIKQTFTDNMDDILDKVGMPYITTRLSIFPDRFPAQFNPEAKSLLVVGVAVDRRSVIKQARRRGLKIISVNPVMGVAPHSRNMDYLYSGDIFFKETASSALPKIIQESRF